MTFNYRYRCDEHAAQSRPPSGEPDAAPALRYLPCDLIDQCKTYRDACVLAWRHRTPKGMTETLLAAMAGLYQQHVSEYFHPAERDEKGRKRRSLPADRIDAVQEHLGNAAIMQWLARDTGMRLVGEFFATEGAAVE